MIRQPIWGVFQAWNIRAGLPERVAMMISGHKTLLFWENNSVGESNLRRAGQKRGAYLETQNGYRTVTIEGSQSRRG